MIAAQRQDSCFPSFISKAQIWKHSPWSFAFKFCFFIFLVFFFFFSLLKGNSVH